jgi:Do/DeqQ family serine protease
MIMRALAILIAVTLLGTASYRQGATAASQNSATVILHPATSDVAALPAAGPPPLASVLARVSPAVVNISVQGTLQPQDQILDEFFRRFFGLPDMPEKQRPPAERFHAVGSGVIIDAKLGYVITNNHVVEKAEKILVTLTDRRQLEAKLVGTDAQADVAVLKIDAHDITAVHLGSSKDSRVGDYVVAIGNPFGLGQTATFGIVSALGRSGLGIEGYEDFIQTDASINPGNSGGALVNMEGDLIGINAAILSGGGGNVGIGFAIPIDMAKNIVEQLIATGKVSRGTLGVSIQDLTPAIANAMGITASEGAIVTQVVPQSAASKAGIKEGDVITALEGAPVRTSAQLRNAIGLKQPGTTVHLTILRDTMERTLIATLDPIAVAARPVPASLTANVPLAGMTLGAIPKEDSRFGKLEGVYVTGVQSGSIADAAGLLKGDVIVSAGHIAVSTPAELASILQTQRKGSPVLLQIRRGDTPLFVAIG